MDENADGGTVVSVTTENANDVTVDDDRFEIADGNLKLKDGTTLNFESDTSPIDVTITATGDGASATATVSVSINDVNEPFTLEAADGAVDENADGAAAGAVTVTDPDPGDTHTYDVSDDRFEVADGMLKLKDGMTLDHETEDSVMVTITVTDGGGHTATMDVTVAVNGVNEAPAISVADGTTPDGMTAASIIDENAAGVPVGEIMASDPDAADTHTFEVSDDRFEAKQDAVGGWWVKLKDGESLDHEAEDSVTVTVTVTDAAGLSASTDVTVTVSDVNEAPSAPEIRGLPQSVDENDEGAVIASLETGTDPEGDTVSFSVDDPRFEVIAGGVLKLKDGYSLNFEEEEGSVDIMVTAMDPSGAMSEATMVTVEIEDENEAPTVMASDTDVDENDAGAVLTVITVSDEDADDTHTVRLPGDFRFTTVTDDNGDMWIALKDGEMLDHEDEDSIPLTVTVTDDRGLSHSVDITVLVNDVNEAPEVSVGQGITPDGVIAAPTVDENNAGAPVGKITFSDVDEGDTIVLSVKENDARFEVEQDARGDWWVKLRDDQSFDFEEEESLTIIVTATDAGGLTAEAEVMLTVRNVDEAPSAPVVRDSGQLYVNENSAGSAVTSLADSTDPENDAITYSVDDPRFVVTSGLVLKLRDGEELDHEAEDSVTLMLTASDPAGNTSDATMITVTVNDENEYPTITAADGSVAENAAGAMVGAVSATDPDDGDSHTFTTDNEDLFIVVDGMLKLVDGASLNFEENESVTVTVTVTDAHGLADSAEVTVTVTDVNEDPSVSLADGGAVPDADDNPTDTVSSLTVPENMAGPPPLALITVTDPDAADVGGLKGRDGMMATTVMVDGEVDERFEVILDGGGGLWLALMPGVTLDHEAETDGMIDVTVTFTDSAGNTADATATVVVTDLNEAPTSVTVQDGTTPDGHSAMSTVDENVPGALLGEIVFEDPDDGDVLTPFVDPTSDFEVKDDSEGGWWLKLKDGVSLDYETGGATVDVVVTVTDNAGLTAETTATITVNDIGESPTAPTARATTLEVTENVAGDTVSVLDASDPQGDAFTFQVREASGDQDRFEVDDQGVLKLKDGEDLDHETDASVDLVLTATDEHDHVSGGTMVSVTVVDVNEAPTVHDEYAPDDITDGAAGEELGIGPIHLEDLFSDQDDTDSLFTYEIEVTRVSGTHGELTLSLTTEDVTYTATAPTVNDVEYEYTPPMEEEDEGMEDGGMEEEEEPMPTDIGAIAFTDPDTGTAAKPGAMGRGDEHTFSVYDKRFEITEDGMLQLNAGLVLEEDTEVHVRVTDRYGLSGTATITITIASDEEEEGMEDGGMEDGGMEDGGMEEEEPDPDTRDVTFITGTVMGTPTAGAAGEWTGAIVATDDGGESARAEFDIVVDDGNDQPTAIHLTNGDSTDNVLYQVEVNENDVSGVSVGTLTVVDIDSANHPYGQHMWYVEGPDNEDGEEKFEIVNGVLKLKAGESLDHEKTPSFPITVTVTDMNGGTGGLSLDQIITVTVNNRNDEPEAADSIGSWWVVVPEDDAADDMEKGEWLSFSLETGGDDNPAFTDDDVTNADGDKLTYSITSTTTPWLEIDADSGMFTNKEGTKAAPGRYSVTVRATDEGQERDEITFMIIVAESDDDNEDNHQPEVRVELLNDGEYDEGSGMVAVARVTVIDNDFHLAPHPYGLLGNDGEPELVNADNDNDDQPDTTGFADQFMLSEDYSQNGNARTWTVYATMTNTLDHETEDDIEFTVRAWNDLDGDGMFSDDEGEADDINIDVQNVNEAPVFGYDSTNATNTAADNSADLTARAMTAMVPAGINIVQEQQEDNKTVIYLNLMELWTDPDTGDDTDDLTFAMPTVNVPWIKVLDFGQWEDVQNGRDREEDDDTDDDTTNDDDPMWAGTAPTDDDDWVAIIEVDRMTNNGQTGDGTVTLTATDEAGASGTATIVVDITDENVLIPTTDVDGSEEIVGTVRVNGVLSEGNGLTMSFNHRMDPDFAAGGAPVLVEYTWTLSADGVADGVDDIVITSYGSPETLMLTQAHVGRTVTASVMYYDTDPETGDIVAAVSGGSMIRDGTVENVQELGTANIVLTTSGTMLHAEVEFSDEDGVDEDATDHGTPTDAPGSVPAYTWEQSFNGVGGWTALEDTATDRADKMIDLGSKGGEGWHYRLVITYQDNFGANERIVSNTIKVGKLADPTTPPSVTGSLAAGGTLIVDSGSGSVQWQTLTPNGWVDIHGATGNLTLTNTNAGTTVRALVTYRTDGNVTAVVAATHAKAGGTDSDLTTLEIRAPTNNAPVSRGDHDDIVATIDKQAEMMPSSVITTVEAEVNVASLFEDADGDMLTYSATVTVVRDITTVTVEQGFSDGNYLRFEIDDAGEGKLLYITDNQNGQQGNGDAGGNVVTITITAADPGEDGDPDPGEDGISGTSDDDNATATSNVNIRLNAVPTEIQGGDTASVDENNQAAADLVTDLNVQDHNSADHEFGQYTWEVSDPDRFTVTPDAMDSSQATLAVKAGQTFPAPDAGGMLTLTITATEVASGVSVTHMVTVTIQDDPTDTDPVAPADADKVPGLKDDETGGDGTETDEVDDDGNGSDSDHDGGLPPPPDPAMMFEDDLLDEFILAIDDIDIA